MSGCAPWWVATSYLAYSFFYETLCLGGCGYAVFVLHQSGWWFLLAAIMSGSIIRPHKWRRLWLPDLVGEHREDREP